MRSKCSILLAEDDEIDVLMLKRAFRKVSNELPIFSVTDGEQVISYLRGSGVYGNREQFPLPDLLLLDLKMPNRTGFEVLQWIRDQPGIRRMPVIVLTSSALSKDVSRAYDLGANSYFVKASDADGLNTLIQSIHTYWCGLAEKPRYDGAS